MAVVDDPLTAKSLALSWSTSLFTVGEVSVRLSRTRIPLGIRFVVPQLPYGHMKLVR